MSTSTPPPVIRIVKKKHAHEAHHGGSWKVAYADFVTAMMAFFLVMWLVAQSKDVKANIAGYFRDPGLFDYQKSNGLLPSGGAPGVAPGKPSDPGGKPDLAGPAIADFARAWAHPDHWAMAEAQERHRRATRATR